MFIADLISWSILIYIVYFVVYNAAVIISSSRGRLFDISKKDYMSKFQQRLTVIIYSHNNSHKVKELIESLNKQEYEKHNYSINVLLDNCNEENAKLLEIIGGTKLWRINTDVSPIGKYKALSWLFERILACENTNAFVFLSADCKIKSDFLQKVNTAVHYNPVVVGEVLRKKNNFYNRILNLKNKLKNRLINHGRFHATLGNIIDSDVLAIRQEVLEKTKFKQTEYSFEEYEYSINLEKNEIPVSYSCEVSVVKPVNETLKTIALKDYQKRYKSFITFRNNIPLLFSNSSLRVKELVLSLSYPSNITFLLWNIALIFVIKSFPETYFSQIIRIKHIYFLIGAKFLTDIYSMLTIRCGLNEYKTAFALFFISPVLFIKSIQAGLLKENLKSSQQEGEDFSEAEIIGQPKGILALFQKRRRKPKADAFNFDKHIVDATITNGRKELPCKIEIIKTDEFCQAVFIFNDKRLRSAKHTRINYAVEEVVAKLKSHGFALKICSNCGYFYTTESVISHADGEQGYCLYNNFNKDSKEREYTYIWDGCPNIIPAQAKNYILQKLGVDTKTRI